MSPRFLSIATLRALGLAVPYMALALPVVAEAQSAPSAYTTGYRYDIAGRQVGVIAPDPDGAGAIKYAATRNTYDTSGNLTKVETGELASWAAETVAPAAWTGFTIFQSVDTVYDDMGRKLKVSVSAGGTIQSVSQYSYDSFGRVDCAVVRMNPAVFASPPASACTLGTEGTQGPDRITRTTYDAYDQVLKIQKAYGTSLQQDYVTYTYSGYQRPSSIKDANGNLATMEYGGSIFDKITKWTFPSKTAVGQVNAADYEQYAYDANGNRTSLRKRDGSIITYSYDALNRNTVKVVPERAGLAATHTRDVYFGYDLRGLQTFARFDSASGEGLTSAYDGFGRLSSSTFTMDGVSRSLSYAVDKNGNRTELTWSDSAKTSYSYDGLNRMSVLYEGAAGSTVNMVSYAYNNKGQRTGQTGRYGQATSFGYDTIGRLSSLGHDLAGTSQDANHTLGYNPASQITSRTTSNDGYAYTGDVNVNRTYAVNGLNQYTSAGPASFTYDANGNLTGDGSSTYVYDIENRLVSASGATTAGLRYDPLGRLYETSGGTAGTTRFLYDGDELVAEYNGTGTMLRRYAHGAGVDDPVLWYEGASIGPARWLHANWQGSVVAITDSSAAVIALDKYDDWGIPGATNQGRFQYTGQAWIPELGMYYYKARIYSPTLGRFLQADPIGYADQINLYSYVANDPLNRRDPTGTFCVVNGQDSKAQQQADCDYQNGSGSAPTSASEREALRQGNLAKYWASRCERGDDIGCLGKGFEENGETTFAQSLAKGNLLNTLKMKYGGRLEGTGRVVGANMTAVWKEYGQIRRELADAHVRAVDSDRQGVHHKLSAEQITRYHWKVFGSHGFNSTLFGGSMITGTMAESKLTSYSWCHNCD